MPEMTPLEFPGLCDRMMEATACRYRLTLASPQVIDGNGRLRIGAIFHWMLPFYFCASHGCSRRQRAAFSAMDCSMGLHLMVLEPYTDAGFDVDAFPACCVECAADRWHGRAADGRPSLSFRARLRSRLDIYAFLPPCSRLPSVFIATI